MTAWTCASLRKDVLVADDLRAAVAHVRDFIATSAVEFLTAPAAERVEPEGVEPIKRPVERLQMTEKRSPNSIHA